jgi:hypothetical protein
VSDGFFAAFELTRPASQIFPKLSKTTPQPLEWWAWRELRAKAARRRGWSLARRHAELVRKHICHYDDGNVHTGKLHCFCREHKQGVEYGLISRVMPINLDGQPAEHPIQTFMPRPAWRP